MKILNYFEKKQNEERQNKNKNSLLKSFKKLRQIKTYLNVDLRHQYGMF